MWFCSKHGDIEPIDVSDQETCKCGSDIKWFKPGDVLEPLNRQIRDQELVIQRLSFEKRELIMNKQLSVV